MFFVVIILIIYFNGRKVYDKQKQAEQLFDKATNDERVILHLNSNKKLKQEY